MNLLLDTHICAWGALEPWKLTSEVTLKMGRAEGPVPLANQHLGTEFAH
jgi:hypothetical protein